MTAIPTLTIRQPYASLIMCGVKTWETRPYPPNGDTRPAGVRGLPGVAINRGDRIGIHAAAKRITDDTYVGARWEPARHPDGRDFMRLTYTGWMPESVPDCIEMRYGCLLGTVTVTQALPVRPASDRDPLRRQWIQSVQDGAFPHRRLYHWAPAGHGVSDISDQLPYGDWSPGRWAWQLADPEPLPEPIPMVGRQGVWRWQP